MASRHNRYRALFAEDAERVLRDLIGLVGPSFWSTAGSM